MVESVPTRSYPEADMKLWPSRDPNSDKYPDRVFYKGAWRTPEQVERCRERSRKRTALNPEKVAARNQRRLYLGDIYVGYV